MKATDIKLGDKIEFKYNEIKIKGTVTNIERERFENSTHGDTDFAIFTVRDEDKNSPTYYQYIKCEERKMKNIHEVLELTIPLTDRERVIIRYYENHISNMYSTVEDELQTARQLIDKATRQLTSVENEVFGDKEEDLIEYLEEQEAEERRNSIQDIVGKE